MGVCRCVDLEIAFDPVVDKLHARNVHDAARKPIAHNDTDRREGRLQVKPGTGIPPRRGWNRPPSRLPQKATRA